MKKIVIGLLLALPLLAGCDGALAPVEKVDTPLVDSQKDWRPELGREASGTPDNQANPMDQTISQPTAVDQASFTDLAKEYRAAILKTNYGDIEVEFFSSDSPNTVNNFLNLAQRGFYDGTKFHRVIKDFMIQGGDPLSKGADRSVYGTGGPGYRFADEFNRQPLVRGSLAMANAGPGTNGSQFFIVTASSTPWLDGKHTNFGRVARGMETVAKIEAAPTGQADQPLEDVVVSKIELVK